MATFDGCLPRQAAGGVGETVDEAVGPIAHGRVFGIGHQIPAPLKEPQRGLDGQRALVPEHLGGITVGGELIAVKHGQGRLHPDQSEPALGDMMVGDVPFLVGAKEGGHLRADTREQPSVQVDPRFEGVEDRDPRVRKVVPGEDHHPPHDVGVGPHSG